MELHRLLGKATPTEGMYGVEVECESSKTYFPGLSKQGWFKTDDGSLRKDWNTEYVFKKPLDYVATVKALVRMQETFKILGVVNEPSVRTGVHVHMNCTNLTSAQVLNFILSYLSMERVLTKYCGPTREGNLFCLRVSDCPGVVVMLQEIFSKGSWHDLHDQQLRYSGLNATSLVKHGSLEFRALQTPVNPVDIKDWIDLLTAVFEYSKGLEAGVKIPYDISYFSPELWVRKVLGERLFNLVYYESMGEDVMKDMRNIQSLYHTVAKDFPSSAIVMDDEEDEEEDLF